MRQDRAIVNRDADLARSRAMVHISGIEEWLHTALAGVVGVLPAM